MLPVMRRLLLALGCACSLSAMPAAQDPVAVAPQMVKVEFENDQIRVLRSRYAPHQAMPMHSHPGRVVILLTDANRVSTTPDGVAHPAVGKSGEVAWRDGGTHALQNLGDTPMETIEIEVKRATAAGVPVTLDIPANPAVPMPVQFEPHHHFAFQNQYVRVMDVLMPVGEPSQFHTHALDNVSVDLSGDKSQGQPMGGEWQPAVNVVHGSAAFHRAVGQPYTHRVRSAGQQDYHVIDIEILP